jgi:sarcosine oxidase subunit beta
MAFFVRSDGPRILFGATNGNEEMGYNVTADWAWQERVLEMAAPRFEWLAEAPLDPTGSWACCYEVSPDHTAILGPAPEHPTWINACAFSGHGVMQAPAVGQLVAEQVVDGATSIDVSPLLLSRFAEPSQSTNPHVLVV